MLGSGASCLVHCHVVCRLGLRQAGPAADSPPPWAAGRLGWGLVMHVPERPGGGSALCPHFSLPLGQGEGGHVWLPAKGSKEEEHGAPAPPAAASVPSTWDSRTPHWPSAPLPPYLRPLSLCYLSSGPLQVGVPLTKPLPAPTPNSSFISGLKMLSMHFLPWGFSRWEVIEQNSEHPRLSCAPSSLCPRAEARAAPGTPCSSDRSLQALVPARAWKGCPGREVVSGPGICWHVGRHLSGTEEVPSRVATFSGPCRGSLPVEGISRVPMTAGGGGGLWFPWALPPPLPQGFSPLHPIRLPLWGWGQVGAFAPGLWGSGASCQGVTWATCLLEPLTGRPFPAPSGC